MTFQVNEVSQRYYYLHFKLLYTFALFTTVGTTVNSTFIVGNWSRPSGNTDLYSQHMLGKVMIGGVEELKQSGI